MADTEHEVYSEWVEWLERVVNRTGPEAPLGTDIPEFKIEKKNDIRINPRPA